MRELSRASPNITSQHNNNNTTMLLTPSAYQGDVMCSEGPSYFAPSGDWYHRFWQYNTTYSDRWYDFCNFRDQQTLPTAGMETCTAMALTSSGTRQCECVS